MKRILSALATLAFFALAPGVDAQPTADPIGDLIARATASPEIAAPETTAQTPSDQIVVPEISAPPPAVPPVLPAPDWRMRATLYHSGAAGVGVRDATGCRVVPMRTVAVDRNVVPRRSILFIRETVGLIMPDGSRHDGYWYASDTGGAIRGQRIDLFTGMTAASMRQMMRFSTATVTVSRVGTFEGCPTAAGPGSMQLAAR